MKKYLALILGVLFVFGFAASAFAIHAEIPSETQAVVAKGQTQITIGGEIRVRGEYRNNNEDFNNDVQTSSTPASAGRGREGAFWDQRVRLSVEAKVTPNTSAMIQIESGNSDSSDNVTWGASESIGARGTYQFGNSKKGDLRILQAWILHQGSGLLGIPALVKVGHMPIKVGQGLFIDHTKFGDDAVLLGISPVKNMDLIAAYVKAKEGNIALNDDGDVYALLMNYPVDKNLRIGGDVSYVNHQNSFGVVAPALQNGVDVHLWNIGLNGDVNIAGFGINADLEFQMGTLKAATDRDFQAFAGKLGFSYTLAPVKLTLEGAYGSGDNSVSGTDDKINTFTTSQGVDLHYTYVYEYTTVNAANNASGGLQNTWYVKLGGNFDLMKDLNADLNVYYLQAVKKTNIASVYGFANNTDSRNIGWEIDAKVLYKIDRNLNYWVEGGYLFAGNFWKVITGPGRDPDDAWAVRQGIQLNF